MDKLQRKETVMNILDAWLLHKAGLKYSNVYVMPSDCVSSDDEDIIGITFEMSMLTADDYWNDMMTELIEVIRECGYKIEWYNSIEMHIYPQDNYAEWERYYDLVRYRHL